MPTLLQMFSLLALVFTVHASQAKNNPGNLDAKSREYLKVLAEGAEEERLVDMWTRVQPYMSPALRKQFAPLLANLENAPAARMKVEGNKITVTEDQYTIVTVVETKGEQNVVTINGVTLAKSDYGSVASLEKKLEQILRDEVKKKKRATPYWPMALLLPEANAFLTGMTLMTTIAGAAIGYGWQGTGQGAIMGAGVGLLGGLLLEKMTEPACTPVSYWNGSACQAACVQNGSGFPSTCQAPGAVQYASAAPAPRIYDPTPMPRFMGTGLRSTPATTLGQPAPAASAPPSGVMSDRPTGSAR